MFNLFIDTNRTNVEGDMVTMRDEDSNEVLLAFNKKILGECKIKLDGCNRQEVMC